MRLDSATNAKWGRKPHRLLPKRGSRTRQLYDELFAHRGRVVHINSYRALNGTITALNDFYGCDIRHFGQGRYSLVGEWVDKDYIDYVAEKLEDKP